MKKLNLIVCLFALSASLMLLIYGCGTSPTGGGGGGGGAGPWTITTVDDTADTGRYSSLVIDPSGNPWVAYSASDESGTRMLKLASWEGTRWDISTAEYDTHELGWDCTLKLDSSGLPRIVFYEQEVTGVSNLRYAICTGPSSWTTLTIQNGTGISCRHSSFDLYNDIAYISYSFVGGAAGALKFATVESSSVKVQTIEAIGTWTSNGDYTSLRVNSNGSPEISYQMMRTAVTKLGFAQWTGSDWKITTIETTNPYSGASTSLVITSDGTPEISYMYNTSGLAPSLKFAKLTGTSWTMEVVDAGPLVMYTSTSIALDSSGLPGIAYIKQDGVLYFARYDGISWQREAVAAAGDAGNVEDESVSLLFYNNKPMITYYDKTSRKLKFAVRN